MSRMDYPAGATIYFFFNTRTAAGAPITLAGTPAAAVHKDNGTTESTAGVTLTVDFDSRTGLHCVAVNTGADGAFYSAGSDFHVILTAGTVDGTSVVGARVAEFSIQKQSGFNYANKANLYLASGYIGGNSSSEVLTIENTGEDGPTIVIRNTAGAGLALYELLRFEQTGTGIPCVQFNDGTGTLKANITGNLSGSVGSVATGGITSASFAAGAITAAAIAAAALNGKGDWSTYAGTDTAGTTTLLARLTALRAGYLDNLNVGGLVASASSLLTTDSRVQTLQGSFAAFINGGTYVAPDNAGIAAAAADAAQAATDAGTAAAAATDILVIANKHDTMLVLDGAVWKYTTNALENAPAGGGGGSGWTGSLQVTLRFEDAGAVAVPNAKFAVVGIGAAAAGADGTITVGLDPGTYTMVVSPVAGTFWVVRTFIVDAQNLSHTFTGTAQSIPVPSNPEMATAYLDAYNEKGVLTAGIPFEFQLVAGPGTAGFSWSRESQSAVSGVNGRLTLELPKSTRWQGRRQHSNGRWSVWHLFDVGTGSSVAVPELLGRASE